MNLVSRSRACKMRSSPFYRPLLNLGEVVWNLLRAAGFLEGPQVSHPLSFGYTTCQEQTVGRLYTTSFDSRFFAFVFPGWPNSLPLPNRCSTRPAEKAGNGGQNPQKGGRIPAPGDPFLQRHY